MILKGVTRADGGKLADYLLSSKNEQVRVLDISGTVIDDRSPYGLKQALCDMDEMGKMTRAKSSLFHLAINPNDKDRMTAEGWKTAIDKVEKALKLEGQARAIVSHIYQGKEHLHVVWSRVNVETRKCVEMSFSKLKLCKTAREIEIELGLQQTPERVRGAHKLKQHIKDIQRQQDERTITPREELNAIVAQAWEQSKNGQEFKTAIEEAGYILAMGERYISVMNAELENYPVQRCVEGLKIKGVREKLGDIGELPTIEEVRARAKAETETAKENTRTEKTGDTKKPVEKYIDPKRRHGQNWTSEQHERGLASSVSKPNGIRQDYQRMPWETEQEAAARAARTTAHEAHKRTEKQAREAGRENGGLVQREGETVVEFKDRMMRKANDPDKTYVDKDLKAEKHHRPKGRVRSLNR